MKHDTLAKLRREELLEKWAQEGKVELVHAPYIDWSKGVHVAVPVVAVKVGEHTFNDAKDLYPSEFLIARVALAIEAGQAPKNDFEYGGPRGMTGATGVVGATGIPGTPGPGVVINGSVQGYQEYGPIRPSMWNKLLKKRYA